MMKLTEITSKLDTEWLLSISRHQFSICHEAVLLSRYGVCTVTNKRQTCYSWVYFLSEINCL